MTALMQMIDLSVSLPTGGLIGSILPGFRSQIDILQGITLSINAGETLGLVGESGSGKTTLAKAILGLQAISGGNLYFDGRPLQNLQSFADLRRATALMFQDPVASLSPRMRIDALLTEPMVIHGVPVGDRAAQAGDMLDRVGLPPELGARYPHELSGGQARRVCVARALALNPSLVIADEPTAGLDVSVQGEILNLMADLKARLGISFLVISHNLAVVRHVTDRIAILYLGRLVETGPTREVFARPLHPYTRNLIASEPQPDPRMRRADLAIRGEIPSVLRRPEGCELHTRCPVARELCQRERPRLRQIESDRFARCHYAGEPTQLEKPNKED